jgi:hypothetical protein
MDHAPTLGYPGRPDLIRRALELADALAARNPDWVAPRAFAPPSPEWLAAEGTVVPLSRSRGSRV